MPRARAVPFKAPTFPDEMAGHTPFLVFVKRFATLTPAQRVLAAVAFDGEPLEKLSADEQALARELFGELGEIPEGARRTLVAVCGRASGKSYVLGALRMLHLALEVPLTAMAAGEPASAIIVAPDVRLARHTLKFVSGAVASTKWLASRVVEESVDSLTIARSGGRSVTLECLPATRGGSALRGRSLVGAFLEEAAFFRDADFVVNDVEIYNALAPRLLPGGQIVIGSSPWAESGLVYDRFTANYEKPRDAIACRAPSVLMRNFEPELVQTVEAERRRDPDNARREFDAEFMSGAVASFFEAPCIDRCVREEPLPKRGVQVWAGADFAFRSDSAACVVVAQVGRTLQVVGTCERRPARGKPLVPGEVCDAFAELLRSWGCTSVMADMHYVEAVREHMNRNSITLVSAPMGRDGLAGSYLSARAAMRRGDVVLPDNPRMVAQLRSVTARPAPGGGLSIKLPHSGLGSHGDIIAALVLALWQGREHVGSQLQPTDMIGKWSRNVVEGSGTGQWFDHADDVVDDNIGGWARVI